LLIQNIEESFYLLYKIALLALQDKLCLHLLRIQKGCKFEALPARIAAVACVSVFDCQTENNMYPDLSIPDGGCVKPQERLLINV